MAKPALGCLKHRQTKLKKSKKPKTATSEQHDKLKKSTRWLKWAQIEPIFNSLLIWLTVASRNILPL